MELISFICFSLTRIFYKNKEFVIYGTQIRCLLRNLKNEALDNDECLKPHRRQDNNINIDNFNKADTKYWQLDGT